MSGEIQAAKQRAVNIIDERQGSLDQPQNFVLVPFNDPTVGPLTVTHDPDAFKRAINKLYAHGGGDAPELSMRGIQLAVENSNAGSTIFVITDIDAKDVELQDNVIAQAKQKDIKVTFLLTNRVSTTVCARRTRGYESRVCGNSSALKLGYKLYEHIAKSTGGRILVVSKSNIFKATEVIESTLKQGLEALLIKKFKKGTTDARFYVDSTLKEIYVESEGDCKTITILKPNGTKVKLEGEVRVDKLRVHRAAVNDSFGQYKLNVRAESECSIKISAKSTKGFVKTLGRKITDAKTRKTRIERFEGQALTTDKVVVFIDEFGKQPGDITEKVEFISSDSDESYKFTIEDKSLDNYAITLGEHAMNSLMVVLTGVDNRGYRFQRVSQAEIEYVSVDIDCSAFSDIIFRAGDNATVNVTVRNNGEIEELSMEANDDKGYVRDEEARKIEIKKGKMGTFSISVSAGKGEQTGIVSTVTITASLKGSNNLIFKQCRLIVGQKETPDIESFHIVSNINSRFVETSVSSTVFNNASVGRTAEFNVIMPLDSFITEFSMTIGNETYPGEIKEKEQAKKLFEAARARGITAGHVAAREESTTVFKTSVNLEANKRVLFNLKYQQLLRRSRGQYRHEIIVQTKQPVGELLIDVYICETRPLDKVKVLGFDTEQSVLPGMMTMPGATVDQQRTTAHVSFKPTREEQLELSPLGLNGKFIVEYDVARNRDKEVNEIVADDRHFIHFLSADMETISKRVVFLLDSSASMFGRKMNQVRKAMDIILNGLSVEDHFAIIMFNNNVTRWNPGNGIMAYATDENKASAIDFLNNIKTNGSTNIETAIIYAIDVLKNFSETTEKNHRTTSDFILLLTDGRPTEGEVDSKKLVGLIDLANNGSFGIHTIGFGSLVDADTLAKIASRNNGSSVQIFEDIDADSQISDYFETFARPMLHELEIKYDADQVESASETLFPVLYYGSEIVVTGKLKDDAFRPHLQRRRRQIFAAQMFDFTVRGKGKDEKDFFLDVEVQPTAPSIECIEESTKIENFTERLSVFMELQHMLKRISAENNDTVKKTLTQQTLNQSLEFGFVTPGITSMIVLKPEDKENLLQDLENKQEDVEVIESTEEGSEFKELDLRRPERGAIARLGALPRIVGDSDSTDRPTFGFFGDPHFVVTLSEQLTICFNWPGHEGQIFNLIDDNENGITVNGKIKILRTPGIKKKKIFVDEIGIVLWHRNMTIRITCKKIIIVNNIHGNSTKISLINSNKTQIENIKILVDANGKFNGDMFLEIQPGVVFRIHKMISKHIDKVASHLDFSIIDQEGISENAFGVLGQFSEHKDGKKKDDASIDVSIGKTNEGLLWYKRKPIPVKLKTMYDYGHGKDVECWFLHHVNDVMDKGRYRYLLKGLFDRPDIPQISPRYRS
uniref:inter-alpha-trypsin inhibitor heavy chain H3-like n=1 Tax=Styela clava TaxID=7725 RepID=UPI00193A6F92|nr:inter-alpha-trypsin inhibitor heavy chain H3-like [Styela clava]